MPWSIPSHESTCVPSHTLYCHESHLSVAADIDWLQLTQSRSFRKCVFARESCIRVVSSLFSNGYGWLFQLPESARSWRVHALRLNLGPTVAGLVQDGNRLVLQTMHCRRVGRDRGWTSWPKGRSNERVGNARTGLAHCLPGRFVSVWAVPLTQILRHLPCTLR